MVHMEAPLLILRAVMCGDISCFEFAGVNCPDFGVVPKAFVSITAAVRRFILCAANQISILIMLCSPYHDEARGHPIVVRKEAPLAMVVVRADKSTHVRTRSATHRGRWRGGDCGLLLLRSLGWSNRGGCWRGWQCGRGGDCSWLRDGVCGDTWCLRRTTTATFTPPRLRLRSRCSSWRRSRSRGVWRSRIAWRGSN